MIKKWILFVMIFFLFFSQIAFSGDIYPFETQKQQKQFNTLIGKLRCLVCQNENLASSNAPLALDLRKQIYLMVKQGNSSKTIIEYLVHRYGNFILFQPPMNKETLFLWLFPFFMMLLGFLILYRISKPMRKK